MTYKTLMLKIYRPGRAKRDIMDGAIARYMLALQYLLDCYRVSLEELAASDRQVNRMFLLRLIDKDVAKQLNRFGVEPFKDSLKIEFAAMAANFITQKRNNPSARYPRIIRDGGASPETPETEEAVCRCDKTHPVYFGRYDTSRDYCLLYDESTGRYYAKLYLLNAKNRVAGAESPGRARLCHIAKGMPEAVQTAGKRRFIVVPLAFGKYQLRDLNRLLQNPELVRTARLKKVKDEYYLLVNIACTAPRKARVTARMGIVRSACGGLHYTVCDDAGAVLQSGLIEKQSPDCQKLYLFSKKILEICRRYDPQVIVEARGGKNDKLLLNGAASDSPLTTTEYIRFVKILNYKLQEEGLPSPVELSPNRLFVTCPACGAVFQKSRISSRLFACVECGYAAKVETIGSINLIKKMKNYENSRVPVTVTHFREKKVFANRILGFECTLPADTLDYSQVFYELSLLVRSSAEERISPQKYCLLKKLRLAPNIASAVKLVENTPAELSGMH